ENPSSTGRSSKSGSIEGAFYLHGLDAHITLEIERASRVRQGYLCRSKALWRSRRSLHEGNADVSGSSLRRKPYFEAGIQCPSASIDLVVATAKPKDLQWLTVDSDLDLFLS